MEKIVVSAPGKVILHGEHSVVYGRRALALSVDLRTTLTLHKTTNTISLELPDVDINVSWSLDSIRDLHKQLNCYQNHDNSDPQIISSPAHELFRKFLSIPKDEIKTKSLALISFLHLYFSILPDPLPISVSVNSDMPTGAGLGSSAAYAVCLATALLKVSKTLDVDCLSSSNDLNSTDCQNIRDKICKWAFCSEQIVHGSPSGIDNSICTYGGGVSFKNGETSPLKVPPIEILLVNTRVTRNTKALVNSVKELHTKYPSIIDPILTSMDEVAERALFILNNLINTKLNNDKVYRTNSSSKLFEELYDLVDINHAQLCALGVSHPSLEKIVGIAKSHRLHAKLTGAGGGGFGFVLLGKDSSRESVLECRRDLETEGYQVWNTKLGTPGVILHL